MKHSLNPIWFENRTLKLWTGHLLPRAPFASYLEIGVFCGNSLVWATRYLLAPGGTAIGVDPYEGPLCGRTTAIAQEAFEIACGKVRRLNRRGHHCELIRARSLDYLKAAEGPFDLIFVDGDHRAVECLTDLCLAWDLLAVGGVMVIDDLHLHASRQRRRGPEVQEAWQAFQGCFGNRYRAIYTSVHQAAVEKRK